jgi:biopolymer transport protein ExbB
MKHSHARTARAALAIAALMSLAAPALAQQQRPNGATQQLAPTSQPVLPLQTVVPAPAPVAAQPLSTEVQSSAPQTVPAEAAAEARPLRGAAVMLRELSPWTMFLSADLLVKAVMIGLAFASLVTWTIFFAKMFELSRAQSRLKTALVRVQKAKSLSEAQLAVSSTAGMLSSLLAAAMNEARMSAGSVNDAGIKERAASSFSEIVRAEASAVRRGMGILATIGATAPFVGLFGTVWGIMNSFIGISKLQTTNLAVVAPGIAEALLATAFGLAAAIPAVIIYNHFSRVTKRYLELVNRATGAAGRLLSRDLDRTQPSILSRAAE